MGKYQVSLSTGNLNQSNNAPSFNPDYFMQTIVRNKYRVQTSSNPRYDNYSSEQARCYLDMEMAMEDDVGSMLKHLQLSPQLILNTNTV